MHRVPRFTEADRIALMASKKSVRRKRTTATYNTYDKKFVVKTDAYRR